MAAHEVHQQPSAVVVVAPEVIPVTVAMAATERQITLLLAQVAALVAAAAVEVMILAVLVGE
jgi:hypothetical protein